MIKSSSILIDLLNLLNAAQFYNIIQAQTSNRRETLKKHFSDWQERMDYQNKQEKSYQSGRRRIAEAERVGMSNSLKLTPQEQDTLNYFNGENFYSYEQNLKTPPNIYDTRSSFLFSLIIYPFCLIG